MNWLKSIPTYVLLLLCSFSTFAQITPPTEVYGQVFDGITREPLPYVNIKLHGTVRNTTTDANGYFKFKFIEKADSVMFSYLGYKTKIVVVKRGVSQEVNVDMGTDQVELTEVTIKAPKKQKRVIDTAALYIYRQVLDNKDKNKPDNIASYHYEGYDKLQIGLLNVGPKFEKFFLFKPFRFLFNNKDTTEEGNVFIPGFIQETVTEVYYKKPGKKKTLIKADNISGVENPSVNRMLRYQFQEVNVYENLFVFLGKSFMSPFSPAARGTYWFYVADTFQVSGRITYKLNFVGKNKEDLALKGFAWIDSATWAIRQINFRPNEKSNLNFINDYSVSQKFELIDSTHWMMDEEELQSVGSLIRTKKKTILNVLLQKYHKRRDFVFNETYSDSIFKGDEEVVVEGARKKTIQYWDSARFVPLKKTESMVYYNSDTIKKVPMFKFYQWLGYWASSAFFKAGPIDFGRFYQFVSKNNVEGIRLRFGGRTNHHFSRIVMFQGYVAHGLKDKDTKYYAAMRLRLPSTNDKWQTLDFSYRYDLRLPGQDDQLYTFDNMLTLIGGRTFTRIMKMREINLNYEREWLRGFSQIFMFSDKTFYAIPGVFDFYNLNAENKRRDITTYHNVEFSIDTRYCYKDQYFAGNYYRSFMNNKYPVLLFKYTAGLVTIFDKHYNYHKFNLNLKQRLSSPIGYTYLNFNAGIVLGRVPYPSAFISSGNWGVILNKITFDLMRDYEFVSDRYVQLWVEHHFDGLFLNKIPLVKKLGLREVIKFKGVWGQYNKANNELVEMPGDIEAPSKIPYMEVGFGIENILKLFRVDFVWRLTYRDKYPKHNWGVKVAFEPKF
jgi:hypothetical protein